MEPAKRITVKLKTPNPLFEKWLAEWRDKAMAEDSNMQYCYNKALKSLQKYPLPLATGKSCKILNGFGDKLCAMLDRKLKDYQKNGSDLEDIDLSENDLNLPQSQKTKKAINASSPRKRKLNGSFREYIPAIGSGAYAILLALHKRSLEPDYLGYMLKDEIIKYGQVFSDKSFTKPDPGTFYTAWSSMKTLLSKNLVLKTSHPPKFSLTDEGVTLARKLQENKDNEMEVILVCYLYLYYILSHSVLG